LSRCPDGGCCVVPDSIIYGEFQSHMPEDPNRRGQTPSITNPRLHLN
jgi:hypothetical protein